MWGRERTAGSGGVLMSDEADAVRLFQTILQCSEAVAVYHLRAEPCLELAIANYFAILEAGGSFDVLDSIDTASGLTAVVPTATGDGREYVYADALLQLLSVTQAPTWLARRLLEEVRGSFELAVRLFYDDNGVVDPDQGVPYDFAGMVGEPYERRKETLFRGSFPMACVRGCALGKWVLVNMQSRHDFQSYMLDRDIWSDCGVKELLESWDIVFVQVERGSSAGALYNRLYPHANPPHVSFINPKTGLPVRSWGGNHGDFIKERFISTFTDFIYSDGFRLD